jgi:hypothetical protein
MRTFGKKSVLTALVLGGLIATQAKGAVIGGVDLGNLTNYLFVWTNGSVDANWQSASPGYHGDVGVNGILASERTSGSFPYSSTIYTNARDPGRLATDFG